MLKIAHVREVQSLDLSMEVIAVVREAVTILDAEYGENREASCDLGGYVLVIEAKDEMEQLAELHIDVKVDSPEYIDVIACCDGNVFTSSLILLSSDFSVVVIMPLELLMHTRWVLRLGQQGEKGW